MKSDARRSAIVERLADHVLTEGLSASSLRPLAEAAGLSDRMLLYYFEDKAAVIEATLECVSARLTAVLATHTGRTLLAARPLSDKLLRVLLAEELWPFMRLWLEIAALAARGDKFYCNVGESMARGYLAWITNQLKSTSPKQREADAAKVLVRIEGAMLLKSVGLDDIGRKAGW
jgi:AcrR family transcriptional regulator